MLPRLADEGHFAMLTVRIDGEPAAFQAWFQIGTASTSTATAMPRPSSRFGPGLIALRRAMAAASERGAQRMEYLGGDERYKQELSDRLDPLYQGFGLARGPLGHAYVARARLSVAVRKRLKRSERLHQLYTSGALRVRRSSPSAPSSEDQAAA